MIIAAIVIGITVLVAVLLPFFIGAGGALAPAATETSPERVEALQKSILERYLQDEAAFARKDISKRAWTRRREFLMHRYIDAGRRLDFLRRQMSGQNRAGEKR